MGERKLLFSLTRKDFDVHTFASGGPGGQHQNKTESGVRIVHRDSGAAGESREHRSQWQNKQAAFRRLVESQRFKAWHRCEVARRLGSEALAQEAAERQMRPENLRVEVKSDDGRWVVETEHVE